MIFSQRQLIQNTNMPLQKQQYNNNSEQWQSFCSSVKKTMTGTDEEKDNILRRRLLKFFHSFSLDQNRYYVQRRDVAFNANCSIQISNNSILLYGIDFLTEAKIQQYFSPLQVAVEYYDDSHCSVSFQNYQCLMNGVYRRLKIGANQRYQQFYAKLNQNQSNKLEWAELTPYHELCFERILWFRFLTSHDYQNKMAMGQNAVHQTYLLAKNNFFNEIQKSLQNNDQSKISNSRQRSFSRSRQKRKEEANFSDKSRQRLPKYQYNFKSWRSNQHNEDFECNCQCFSKQIKKFLQFVERDNVCQHKSKANTMRTQHYENNVKKSWREINQSRSIHPQSFKHLNTPISRLTEKEGQIFPNGNKSHSKSDQPGKRQKSKFIEDSSSQNEDFMIKSLVTELEKYKFDEQGASFENHIKTTQSAKLTTNATINERQASTFGMEEESIFEIIDQQ